MSARRRGQIRDGFEEGEKRVEFNGKPAMFVEVMRTGQESAIQISDMVHDYVEKSRSRFPQGIDLFVYDDDSVSIRGRLSTLVSSLLQGSRAGACPAWSVSTSDTRVLDRGRDSGCLLWWHSLDAVVWHDRECDEPVWLYHRGWHRRRRCDRHGRERLFQTENRGWIRWTPLCRGRTKWQHAVTFGALTTMVAFIPLLFFDGRWGEFAKQIPPIVVAPVLLFSLIESKLILPSHLKHVRVSQSVEPTVLHVSKHAVAAGLEWFIDKTLFPNIETGGQSSPLSTRPLRVDGGIDGWLLHVGGWMEFVAFPKVDRNRISMMLTLAHKYIP